MSSLHECVYSIIPRQHMHKLCVLMHNCDFESTLKSRLISRNGPIIGRVAEIGAGLNDGLFQKRWTFVTLPSVLFTVCIAQN